MQPFPYYVIYFIRNHTVTIVSVIHTSRKPSLWKKRIRGEE